MKRVGAENKSECWDGDNGTKDMTKQETERRRRKWRKTVLLLLLLLLWWQWVVSIDTNELTIIVRNSKKYELFTTVYWILRSNCGLIQGICFRGILFHVYPWSKNESNTIWSSLLQGSCCDSQPLHSTIYCHSTLFFWSSAIIDNLFGCKAILSFFLESNCRHVHVPPNHTHTPLQTNYRPRHFSVGVCRDARFVWLFLLR